jgi:predicted anti-sigma-YlaC factor YlaD
MDCDECRLELSAILDGEGSPTRRGAVAEHLADCDACRAWQRSVERLHRRVRVQPADAVPDLGPAILARAHVPDPGRGEWIRTALAVVAVTELVLALPALFGHDAGASVHLARHIGSLSIAMAVGYVYAAWRPVRAYGLLPIALALAGCMIVTAVLDITTGRAGAVGEAHHVLDISALILLWALAGRPHPRLSAPLRRRAPAPAG